MHTKILAFLLILLAVGYAVAPAWVAKGVNLSYSVGSDTLTFTVLERTSTDVRVQLFTRSTGRNSFPDENASAYSGQFWFDDSLLSSASTGSTVRDYSVTDEGTQTFAGTSWDTLTLKTTVSGAVTTKVFDRNTGLLLKQTVDVSGAPVITLVQHYIPGIDAPPAPPPQQNNTAPPQANNTPPAANNTPPAPEVNNTPPGANVTPPSGGNNGTVQPPANQSSSGQPPTPSAPAKKQCCTSAFLLLVVGLVALRNGR